MAQHKTFGRLLRPLKIVVLPKPLMRMREQTDRQFLTEKVFEVFEDFYYVLTLFCIIRYHIHIPYHFCLLNSCFGTYKSVLVAALKKFLAAETNSRSGPRIPKTGSKQSENLVF
jgi:hypothetical protein